MATHSSPVAWESFYKTARWRRLRKFQLMQHPLRKLGQGSFAFPPGGFCAIGRNGPIWP